MKKVITDNEKKYNYEINYGTLSAINQFKEFVGKDQFDNIVNGMGYFDIPFEEEKYEELLGIVISKYPEEISEAKQVPFHHASELVGFFCEPFAGKSLKQVQYTMSTISSLLRDIKPEQLKTMMESIPSRSENGTDTGAAN